ncbi:MAG: hypothetical protein WAY93_01760 [Atopobiaceae bacterium]|jgi:hypothetical protein|nr:hypothetical protein [Atopobiaceae bacterium]
MSKSQDSNGNDRLGKKLFSQGTVEVGPSRNEATPESDDEEILKELDVDAADEEESPVAGASRPEGPSSTRSKGGSGARTAIIVAIVIAAAAALAYFVLLPPSLSNDEILSHFDTTSLVAGGLTNSAYANNGGYTVSDTRVTSVEEVSKNEKIAHVEAKLENTNFEVVAECDQDYKRETSAWEAGAVTVASVKATPITSVDSSRVIDDIDTVLGKVADKSGVRLVDLYSGGTFQVTSNNLDSDKKVATVILSARKSNDLSSYSGNITATFTYKEGKGTVGDAGAWELTSASADDAAWNQTYNSLVGTWKGTLASTATSSLIMNTGLCNAGKATPFTMTVDSMDAATGTMVASCSFVSHNHAAISKNADTTTGDVQVNLTNVTINLDPQTLTGTYEYTGTDASQGTYTITLANASGVWKAQVASGLLETGTLAGIGHVTFTDVYSLARQ